MEWFEIPQMTVIATGKLSSTGISRDCTWPVEDRHDKHYMLGSFTGQGNFNWKQIIGKAIR